MTTIETRFTFNAESLVAKCLFMSDKNSGRHVLVATTVNAPYSDAFCDAFDEYTSDSDLYNKINGKSEIRLQG